MKKILLLAVIALIGSTVHAQSVNPGTDVNADTTKTEGSATNAGVDAIGCPTGQCAESKHRVKGRIGDNTTFNANTKSGSSTGSGGSQGQGGAQ